MGENDFRTEDRHNKAQTTRPRRDNHVTIFFSRRSRDRTTRYKATVKSDSNLILP